MSECRPQDLGECEDEVPVREGADHLLTDDSAQWAPRFAEDDGQNPRYLQEKAIRLEKMAEDRLIRHRVRLVTSRGKLHGRHLAFGRQEDAPVFSDWIYEV